MQRLRKQLTFPGLDEQWEVGIIKSGALKKWLLGAGIQVLEEELTP